MAVVRSILASSQVTIDCENATITGEIIDIDTHGIVVRLLLTDIGVEAGVDGVHREVKFAKGNSGIIHTFEFSGDIVRAALWLRTFRFVAMCSDGQTREISLSSQAEKELAQQGTSHRSFGRVAFHGNSWLFHNRADFADRPVFCFPNPGDLPVFGVLAAAFGDSGWFDDEGHPSAAKFLDQVPRVFEAMAVHRRLLLLIDASNEGQPLHENWISLLHEELDRRGISPRCCIFLQQNRSFKQQYIKWAESRKTEAMDVLVYDYYPRRIVGLMSQKPLFESFSTRPRRKRFCCFNFTPRPNRTSLVSWLLAKGFEGESYISFGGYDHSKAPSRTPILCDWFPDQATVRAGLELLRARLPMVVDVVPGERDVPEYDLGPASVFEDSYFSIVTETEISNGEVIRITEKSIKPMAMYHPFIVLGNPFSLRVLREYGFKTFEGFFDESYDTILDPARRVERIMIEIERLMSLSGDVLHQRYLDLWPKLAFNAAHARRVSNEQFKYEIEPALMTDISKART